MLRAAAIHLLLASAALAAPEAACSAAEGTCMGEMNEESSLVQRPSSPSMLDSKAVRAVKERLRGDHLALAGKSVYFLPVDRFGKTGADADLSKCDNDNHWCNGTLAGLTAHLDYIQGMGFDCVWITPVVKQWPGESPSGTGCMGYWAYNLYEIDPHFGTEADMEALVAGLHERDMCIVYDFVGNHMGPIHNEEMVKEMVPFNKPEYFHQLFRGNMTFDEYTHKKSGWPPPAQAMWSQSGAQCTQGRSCSCYKCVVDPEMKDKIADPFGPCNGEMVYDPESVCPKDALSPYCMPGDYECEGYNQTITEEGWFYDLGDLNQSHPFVREKQLAWIKWFVDKYKIDVLRLDTAAFMTFEFLGELQAAAGVPIIGEVTTTNMTYHANFQADPPHTGNPVLDGVLNFPLYYSALAGFCGKWFPFSTWDLSFLGQRMDEQLQSPYKDLDLLGNFIDNHDVDRIASVCESDISRIKNTITWVMFAKGVPIIYYGTEELYHSRRESLWDKGYDTTTDMYKYLAKLNQVRKAHNIGTDTLEMMSLLDGETITKTAMAFTRGGSDKMWIFLNNLAQESADTARYCGEMPPIAKDGHQWVDALSGSVADFTDGCYLATDTLPKVLVQQAM